MLNRSWIPAAGLAAVIVAASALTVPFEAQAQRQSTTPKSIGLYGDWSAWELPAGKSKICYAATRPKSSEDKGVKRNVVQIQVSNRTADKVKNEVGLYLGYAIKTGSKVTATIDGDSFELVPSMQNGYRETAWLHDPKREAQFVEAMMKGNALKVSGAPEKGNSTTDTYSLNGVTAALKAIADRCK
jgi:invasion protein IalB